VYYFNAYQDLSTCRYHESGFIPWVAVKEYVLNHDGTKEDAEFLTRFCNELDELVFADMKVKDKPGTPDKGKAARKRKRIIGENDGD